MFRQRLGQYRDIHSLYRLPRQHSAGRLSDKDRAWPYLRYLYYCFLRYILLGSLRTSRCFTHPLCCRANRPYNPRLGNACLLDTIFQSVLRSYTGSHYAQCMGCAEQTRHGAGFPHQTSYWFVAALTGIFSHLFRCERCTARCKSQPYLANRTLFHPYYGRNSPLPYRFIHGKQTHPCPFCLSHDGNLVSFHLYSQ